MKQGIAVFLLLCGVALGQSVVQGRLVDVQSKEVLNNSPLGRWARSDGGSAVIHNTRWIVSITLLAEDMSYTANFPASKHLKIGSLIIGDPIAARIDKDNLFIKGDDQKELRGYIVRRERLTATPSPQSASH